MKKNRKDKRRSRNLSLPMWLKLRMDDSFFGSVKWMIDSAEECNAESMRMRLGLKRMPWTATLEVKRHDNY